MQVHSMHYNFSFTTSKVSEKMRCLRKVTKLTLRPRVASVCRGPAQRRFNTNSTRSAPNGPEGSTAPKETVNGKGLVVGVAVVAGLLGYGISTLATGDANKPSSTLAILDPERLPTVKYATLEDIQKVGVTLQARCIKFHARRDAQISGSDLTTLI